MGSAAQNQGKPWLLPSLGLNTYYHVSSMKISSTSIPGVLILEPRIFGDSRGFFLESFNQRAFNAAVGHDVVFVQDNHSRSSRGVLRGLHFQTPPHAQGKLVRVTSGQVFDVAVDIRKESASFGQWVGIELNAENHKQLWLPPGMAHGFFVMSESADFLYKTTDYYAPEAEGCIRWDDPHIQIKWPLNGSAPSLSAKDAEAFLLEKIKSTLPDQWLTT
jgi:dTDP-4-dehydrorhamnose 3,5-epimerase